MIPAASSCIDRSSASPESEAGWDDLDVAVAGGGPAGLAAALALLQVCPDLRIKVFESSAAYTQQGAGVSIAVNGARALQAIDPILLHRLLRDANFMSGIFTYSDASGERMPWVTALAPLASLERYGITGGMVPWNSIRGILYDAAPPGLVEFGCKVMSCSLPPPASRPVTNAAAVGPDDDSSPGDTQQEQQQQQQQAGWCTLRILRTQPSTGRDAEGAASQPPRELCARARHVIAADGFFSRVRRTAGDGKAPVFQRSVRWLGSLPQADITSGKVALPAALNYGTDPHALSASHTWLPDSRGHQAAAARPDRGFITYAAGADETGGPRVVWTLFTSVEALEAAGEEYPMRTSPAATAAATAEGAGPTPEGRAEGGGVDDASRAGVHQTSHHGPRAHQRALAAARFLPADVRALIAATRPERVSEFGTHTHPPEGCVRGAWARGRLLLLGDAAHAGRPDGQGANLALEDAAVLAAAVRDHGLGEEAFVAWEVERMGRVKDILHDPSPDGAHRFGLIFGGAFQPLWCPLKLAEAGGPLPEDVARRVVEAVASGGTDKGREVVLAWSREEMRRIVGAKVAGRAPLQTVEPPPGVFRLR